MNNTKQVNFYVRLMSVRLLSGEELIGAVSMPSIKDLNIDESMRLNNINFIELFYPASISIVTIDNDAKIQVSKWGYITNPKHYSIARHTIISMSPATESAVELYEKWFMNNFGVPSVPSIRSAIKSHFGLVEPVGVQPNKEESPMQIYQPQMFENLNEPEKTYIYATILANYYSSVSH